MKQKKPGPVFRIASLSVTTAALALSQQPAAGGGMPQAQTSPSERRPVVNNPTEAIEHSTQKLDDKTFLRNAAQGGMTEVELGKLATQKASGSDAKQFGQRMVDDHSKANSQLKLVAAANNVEIPDALDSKHRSRIDKLSKLSGKSFDKAYIKDQVKDHQDDVKDFKAEAQDGSDPRVKEFAASTLPTLQEHLEAIKALEKGSGSR